MSSQPRPGSIGIESDGLKIADGWKSFISGAENIALLLSNPSAFQLTSSLHVTVSFAQLDIEIRKRYRIQDSDQYPVSSSICAIVHLWLIF